MDLFLLLKKLSKMHTGETLVITASMRYIIEDAIQDYAALSGKNIIDDDTQEIIIEK
jgi:hypothetical protein